MDDGPSINVVSSTQSPIPDHTDDELAMPQNGGRTATGADDAGGAAAAEDNEQDAEVLNDDNKDNMDNVNNLDEYDDDDDVLNQDKDALPTIGADDAKTDAASDIDDEDDPQGANHASANSVANGSNANDDEEEDRYCKCINYRCIKILYLIFSFCALLAFLIYLLT